jgi:transcription elongation GreA/GreB family factor
LRPDWERADLLERELDRAEVVDNSMLPSGVIKMNYRVRVTDLTTSTQTVYTLVFPCEANASPSEVW